MGELDEKPFLSAAKRKYSGDEVNLKAVELCSQYEAYLRDPTWFPFKVLIDKEGKAKVQSLPELLVQIEVIFFIPGVCSYGHFNCGNYLIASLSKLVIIV